METKELSIEDGLKIQKEHLHQWKEILKPEVFAEVEKLVIADNGKAESGYQIKRGDDIRECLNQVQSGIMKDQFLIPKISYIVHGAGIWGRGTTLQEAAKKCFSMGGIRKTELVRASLFIGDDTPEINNAGYFIYDSGSTKVELGLIKLGALCSAE